MALKQYNAKRDFTKTPEPGPKVAKSKGGQGFVVQKHDASRLHYDFRLEHAGVLWSWAVPKGPSLDPADKRLAVHVEDHPVQYAAFEGTIPEGQYGGGTVMVWDRGMWEPLDPDPAAVLRKGKLSFVLHGKKLRGKWTLMRIRDREGDSRENWLLIKGKDEFARPGYDVTEAEPLSVKSGRDLDEIAAAKSAVWQSSSGSVKGGAVAQMKAAKAKAKTKPGGKAESRGKSGVRRARPTASRAKRSPVVAAGPRIDPAVLPGAREAPMPTEVSPQLCMLAEQAPAGEGWLHEVKFDGYRLLAHRKGDSVRLVTRAGKDWTDRFGPIARAIADLPVESAIFDGEATVSDPRGQTSFQRLQQAIKKQDFGTLAFYVFDLIYCNGYDLRGVSLRSRKELLAEIVPAGIKTGLLRQSEHIEGSGPAVHANACKLSLEGIISKRADSLYMPGRSGGWLKIKCTQRQEFVIVGFTPPEGSRKHFGSLLLAARDEQGRLRYTGRVGTGFNAEALDDIAARLKRLERATPPLDLPAPREVQRDAAWVEPKLVGEVAFTEWTDDGVLRHPSFQGLREDKEAAAVKIERPKASAASGASVAPAGKRQPEHPRKSGVPRVSVRPRTPARRGKRAAGAGDEAPVVAGVTITSADRVIYPEMGITKLALAQYYELVSEFILPHVIRRPLSVVRCPAGRSGQCFFQKHLGETLGGPVKPMKVMEKDGPAEYISVDSREGLITLIQFGVLEIHAWGARIEHIEQPDCLTFDFDPGEGVGPRAVKDGAERCREILEEYGLRPYLKTSGGKGLHVVTPLKPSANWEEAKAFAAAIAQRMTKEQPEKYLATMSKAKRQGKIFVDYLRNGRGATSVAPYSTRARTGAPVSMPISWDQLGALKSFAQFTVANTPEHLKKRRRDPWADFFKRPTALTRSRLAAAAKALM